MNIAKITETLEKFYNQEGRRIVFWNDAEAEFLENLNSLVPHGVELLRVDEIGALAAKIRLELEAPEQKFLVYSPTPQPASEADWLLDVRLYSKPAFTADAASLLLNELGLQRQSLREFLQGRKAFFASKDRLAKLQRWVLPEDNEAELDKKMLAVTVRAEQPDTFQILLKIFAEFAAELRRADIEPQLELQPASPPPGLWNDLEKFNLNFYFLGLITETFGYDPAKFSFYDLLARLFVTDFANNLKGAKLPSALAPLNLATSGATGNLKKRAGAFNASVFLAHWRTNISYLEDYKFFADRIAAEIGIDELLAGYSAFDLADNEAFREVERRTVSDLRDRLLAPLPSETADWQNLINIRRDRFWTREGGSQDPYGAAYGALSAMLGFLRLKENYRNGFGFADSASAFAAYSGELYRFDQFYRLFTEAARTVKAAGWNLLTPLSGEIEKIYGNWFLETLATGWGKCVENEKLFENWQIADVPNQYRFFERFIKPLLQETADRKIYVIVSDAFRYECAEELTRALNSEARKSGQGLLKAELSAQLGVVPSYTALGMAALLPHEMLDYKVTPSGGDVTADGVSTSGTANRKTILGKFGGTAIRAQDFNKLNKDTGRDFVRDYRAVYVYHNVVDATGEQAATESETFSAVRKAIEEIGRMINFIANSLNGSQIFVTADHGFLYQENAPATLDRSELEVSSSEVLKRKKRYVINPEIDEQANAWRGSINKTARIQGEMQFLIPKGANLFHFAGGARFVHGGAMPQEIIVPVVTVKKLRGQTAAASLVSQVGVTLLGNLTRIVNNVQRFEFIQTEKVSERMLPRTLKISLRDHEGNIISNEETATFDNASDSMDERRKSIQLFLKAGNYNRRQQYFLVLIDETAVIKEYQKYPLLIDIALSSDF